MKQILLNAKECSGRGVRIRTLSLDARLRVTENAAAEIGKDGTMIQFRAREAVDSVAAFVAEVTEKTGFKTPADLIKAGKDASWKKVTVLELTEGAAKYFNSKDMSALSGIFKAIHDVTATEVDDILGEAQDVTDD